jgi:hypothetical protein
MAEHGTSFELTPTLPENDYSVREHNYRTFLKGARWALAIIVVILALMAIFLT